MEEELKLLLDKANRHLNTADHLTYVTYPLVKDIKILFSIVDNLSKSLNYGMESILYYDKLFKRIPLYPNNFELKFKIFQRSCVTRYNIKGDQISLIEELNTIMEKHRNSSMVFQRQDKLVISNHDYRLKTLSIEDIKKYLANAKLFIFKVNSILEEYVRLR